MLATIPSASLLGASGIPSPSRSTSATACPASASSACPTRRAASRATGSGPRVMSTGARVADEAHHRQPRPVRRPQVGRRARPGDRRRRARRHASSCRPAAVDGLGFVGELGLDGSLRRSPAWRRWSPCSATSTPSCRRRQRRRGAGRGARDDGARGVDARRAWSPCSAGARRGPTSTRRTPLDDEPPRRPIWPTCAASPSPAGRSRSPPPAATTCCSSARPARARRCSPSGCPACSRRSSRDAVARGHDGPLGGRPAAAAGRAGRAAAVPGAAPHRPPSSPSSAAARRRCGRARSALRHGGVLFLDELGEFAPAALDGLREPLEEGVIRVARANGRAVLPARFQLVAATNPCPCGGGPPGACECDDVAPAALPAPAVGPAARPLRPPGRRAAPRSTSCSTGGGGEPSAVVAARVAGAGDVALDRPGVLNAELPRRAARRVRAARRPARSPCCATRSSATG